MTAASHKKTATRDALLQIAAAMIRKDGFARFTLRGLAREKGWSAPSIYEYFGSVDEIIAALRERAEEEFYTDLSAGAAAADNQLEGVRRLIAAYIRFFDGRRDRFEIMFEASKTLRPRVDAPLSERSSYALLVNAMRQLCAEKACDQRLAEDWAFAAWSYAHGVCALRAGYLSPLAQDIAPLAARGVEILIAGIEAQNSARPA